MTAKPIQLRFNDKWRKDSILFVFLLNDSLIESETFMLSTEAVSPKDFKEDVEDKRQESKVSLNYTAQVCFKKRLLEQFSMQISTEYQES